VDFCLKTLPLGTMRLGIASAATLGLLVALPGTAQAASTPVPLGTAKSFVVLAGAGITNTGPTTLIGDLGTFPTKKITGAGSLTVTGTNHHFDAVTQQAKNSLVTGYNAAAGQGPTSPIAADLAGKTLKRGVYNSASSIKLTGAMTLDAAGDRNAVFVFQGGSALTTETGSQIKLINGASACNVFWQLGTSATLGTNSKFVGTILAKSSITATTGASVQGRLLARNGAVTLDTNTITKPSCTAPVTSPARKTTKAPTAQIKGTMPTGGVEAGGGGTINSGQNAQLVLGGSLLTTGFGIAGFVAVRRRRHNA
jgi:hypothetical protein